MNFGDCPYDDCKGIVSVAVPDRTPAYTMIVCDECGRDVWYRCSRIDPRAWTREAFEAGHVIDQEARTVVPKAQQDGDGPIERAAVSAKELAALFSDSGDFARAYADGLRTIFDQWSRQVLAAIIRGLFHPRYLRLRRQHIAKARGKNWRSIR